MPWPFKAALAAFLIFAVGATLIGIACITSGFGSITYFAYGLLTAAVGLFGALLFCVICAVIRPAWRRRSLAAGGLALLLSAALLLFARSA